MENLSSQPILILRNNNLKFLKKQKILNKRIKSKKFLKQEINCNNQIFQSNINLYRNKTAQNLIWQKNYKYKCIINKIKDQNSSLKAKIWNIQKQNRKMQRQIQSWNLNQQQCLNLKEKPYISMSTYQKVIKDQDYNIVSMKIQIFQLQKAYNDKQNILNSNIKKIKNIQKIVSLFNHQISTKKIQLSQLLYQNQSNHQSLKAKLSDIIINQNRKIDLIDKNRQIKQKSKLNIQNDLQLLRAQCQAVKGVNFKEIERLNDQIKQMRVEEIGGINREKEKIKKIKRQVLDYQCYMQEESNKYIKQKIQLTLQIDKLKQQLMFLPQISQKYIQKNRCTILSQQKSSIHQLSMNNDKRQQKSIYYQQK